MSSGKDKCARHFKEAGLISKWRGLISKYSNKDLYEIMETIEMVLQERR